MSLHGRFEPFTLQLSREGGSAPVLPAAAPTPHRESLQPHTSATPARIVRQAQVATPVTQSRRHELVVDASSNVLLHGRLPLTPASVRSVARHPFGRTPRPAFGSPLTEDAGTTEAEVSTYRCCDSRSQHNTQRAGGSSDHLGIMLLAWLGFSMMSRSTRPDATGCCASWDTICRAFHRKYLAATATAAEAAESVQQPSCSVVPSVTSAGAVGSRLKSADLPPALPDVAASEIILPTAQCPVSYRMLPHSLLAAHVSSDTCRDAPADTCGYGNRHEVSSFCRLPKWHFAIHCRSWLTPWCRHSRGSSPSSEVAAGVEGGSRAVGDPQLRPTLPPAATGTRSLATMRRHVAHSH